MSDRTSGSSQSNPIKYRGYEIALADYSPAPQFDWEYVHENYDGPEDGRGGRAASVEACKAEIDEMEEESNEELAEALRIASANLGQAAGFVGKRGHHKAAAQLRRAADEAYAVLQRLQALRQGRPL